MSVSLYLIGFGQIKFWYYLHLNYHKSWWFWRWDVSQIKVCIQCGAVWADGRPSRATFRLLSRTTTSKYQVKCGSEVFGFVFAAFISLSFTASHLKTSSETWVKNIWLIFVSIDAQYSQPFPNTIWNVGRMYLYLPPSDCCLLKLALSIKSTTFDGAPKTF